MRIGILKVDSVHEDLVADYNDYDQMFADLFERTRPQWQLELYDVLNLELPKDLNACDGYLITGSQYSTYDDLPWIPVLEKFVQRCHGAQKKLIGVCFGHQIIAQALGGESSFSDRGWGVGIIAQNIDEPLFFLRHKPDDFRIIYSHQDQVQKLPKGAQRLVMTTVLLACTKLEDISGAVRGILSLVNTTPKLCTSCVKKNWDAK